jgi:hypothetical protein
MNRRELIPLLIGMSVLSPNVVKAKDPAPEKPDAAPRWKFLGDDGALRHTIKEAGQVVLICVYQTSLNEVSRSVSEVVLRATVVQTIKGAHAVGDKIVIRFMTDSLPADEKKRDKFIDDVANKNLGSLKMAFLTGDKMDDYTTEWLYVPNFDPDMLAFAVKNRRQ